MHRTLPLAQRATKSGASTARRTLSTAAGGSTPPLTTPPPQTPQAPLPQPLLDLLACPLSKETLQYDAARSALISPAAGVIFPVKDGVVNLNPRDAALLE